MKNALLISFIFLLPLFHLHALDCPEAGESEVGKTHEGRIEFANIRSEYYENCTGGYWSYGYTTTVYYHKPEVCVDEHRKTEADCHYKKNRSSGYFVFLQDLRARYIPRTCVIAYETHFKDIKMILDNPTPGCDYNLNFSLDGGPMQTVPVFPNDAGQLVYTLRNLPVGMYDSAGNLTQGEVNVTSFAFETTDCGSTTSSLSAEINGIKDTKFECEQDYYVDVSGGKGPYLYEWTSSVAGNYGTGGRTLYGLKSPPRSESSKTETLIVTVRDANGCETSDLIRINYHPELKLFETSDPVRKEESTWTQIGPLVDCEMTNPPRACEYNTSQTWSTSRRLGVSASVEADATAVAAKLGVERNIETKSEFAQAQRLFWSPGTSRALGAKLVWIERNGTYKKFNCDGVSDSGTWTSKETPGETNSSAWRIGLYLPTP